MAEENTAEGTEEEEEKSKKSNKMLFIIVGAVALITTIVVVVVIMMSSGGEKSEDEGTPEEKAGLLGGKEDKLGINLFFVTVPPLQVNFNSKSGDTAYLKLALSFEVRGGAKDVSELEEKMPRIVSSYETFLRQLREEDLNGSAGIYRLKEDLLRRVNNIVTPTMVTDILFNQIIIQ